MDQISEGRFEFGVGRSGNVRAYDIMGIDYGESKERFQEALDIILQAWKGETFSYEGKYNHITNASVSPTPHQKPHPKVRIAASSEDSFGRIGRLGQPIFLGLRAMDVEDLKTNLQEYRSEWQAAGHPGDAGDINVRFPVYIAPSDTEAIEEPKESIETFFRRQRELFEYSRGREGTERTEVRQAPLRTPAKHDLRGLAGDQGRLRQPGAGHRPLEPVQGDAGRHWNNCRVEPGRLPA